jgi:hypothetical protein
VRISYSAIVPLALTPRRTIRPDDRRRGRVHTPAGKPKSGFRSPVPSIIREKTPSGNPYFGGKPTFPPAFDQDFDAFSLLCTSKGWAVTLLSHIPEVNQECPR